MTGRRHRARDAFAEIADEWMCPICDARKTDFRALEPGEEILEDWGN